MIDQAYKEAGKFINERYPYNPEEKEDDNKRDYVFYGFTNGYRKAIKDKYKISETDEYMANWITLFLKGTPMLQHDCDMMAAWLDEFVHRFTKIEEGNTPKDNS